jgi:hypothetical protein
MSDPGYRRGRRNLEDYHANSMLIMGGLLAMVLIVGIVLGYSFSGSSRMDNTAAIERSATGPAPKTAPAQRRETTGSNVRPAAAPSPQR